MFFVPAEVRYSMLAFVPGVGPDPPMMTILPGPVWLELKANIPWALGIVRLINTFYIVPFFGALIPFCLRRYSWAILELSKHK